MLFLRFKNIIRFVGVGVVGCRGCEDNCGIGSWVCWVWYYKFEWNILSKCFKSKCKIIR